MVMADTGKRFSPLGARNMLLVIIFNLALYGVRNA